MHTGRQAHENNARARIAEGRDRPAVVAGFVDVDGIQKRRKTRAAPAINIKNWVHAREGVSHAERKEKTGYADHRVARHRSRLDFGLTRAQLNLAQKACKPCHTPAARERFLALANFCWLDLAQAALGALKLGCGEGSRCRIAPDGSGASRVFKNCRPIAQQNRHESHNLLNLLSFMPKSDWYRHRSYLCNKGLA